MTLPEVSPSQPFEILHTGRIVKGDREVEITEADLDRAVENFEALTAQGHEVPIDRDHAFVTSGSSRAVGWVRDLFREGRKLFARVDWTETARREIASDEYRYFSAEIDPDWQDESGRRWGFTVLAGALTNRPHLKSLAPVALSDSDPISFIAGRQGEILTSDPRRQAFLALFEDESILDATVAALAERSGVGYSEALQGMHSLREEIGELERLRAEGVDIEPHLRVLELSEREGISYTEAAERSNGGTSVD